MPGVLSLEVLSGYAQAVVMAAGVLSLKEPYSDRFTVGEVVNVLRRSDEECCSEELIAVAVLGARYAYEAGWILDVRPLSYSDMSRDTPVGRPTWRGVLEVARHVRAEEARSNLDEGFAQLSHLAQIGPKPSLPEEFKA